jgi:hypothetical protein
MYKLIQTSILIKKKTQTHNNIAIDNNIVEVRAN